MWLLGISVSSTAHPAALKHTIKVLYLITVLLRREYLMLSAISNDRCLTAGLMARDARANSNDSCLTAGKMVREISFYDFRYGPSIISQD